MADVMRMAAELEFNEKKSVQQLLKVISAAGKASKDKKDLANVIDSQLRDGVNRGSKNFISLFNDLKARAARLALDPFRFDKLQKKFFSLQSDLDEATKRAQELNKKYTETQDKSLKKIYKRELGYQHHLMRVKSREMQSALGKENQIQERRQEYLDEYNKLSKRSWKEGMEERAKGLANTFEQLKSGNVGLFADIFKAAGKGVAVRGAGLKEKYAGGEGVGAKSMGALGGILGKLGPALLTLGAMAGAFTAILGIIMAADAQIKEMNKAILEGGVLITDLGDSTKNWEKNLKMVTDAFSDMTFAQQWGMGPKELMGVVAAYQEGGLSVKKMTKGIEDQTLKQERLKQVTAGTLAYARLFGVAAPEMARTQAEMMQEWGVSLDQVKDQYGLLYQAASQSSFGTKRFYSMVLNATSGMAGYNVRMEEAAALLLRLSKVMSPKQAEAFMQSIMGKYEEMGLLERYKEGMMRGPEKTVKLMQKNSKKSVEILLKEQEKNMSKIQMAFIEAGVSIDWSSGVEGVAKQFSKLNDDQQAAVMSQIRLVDSNKEFTESVKAALGASEAMKGDLKSAAEAMDYTKPGTAIALKLTQLDDVLGKPLHELNFEQRNAAEKLLGVQGKSFVALKDLSQAMYGNFKTLQRQSKRIQDLKAAADSGNEVAKQQYKEWLAQHEQMQKEQINAWDATLDRNGNIISGAIDSEGKIIEGSPMNDVYDYMATQGEALQEAAKDTAEKNLDQSKKIVDATTDLATRIQIGVEVLLKKIYGALEPFLDWFKTNVKKIITYLLGADESAVDIAVEEQVGKLIAETEKARVETVKKQSEVEAQLEDTYTKIEEFKGDKSSPEFKALEEQAKSQEEQLILLKKQEDKLEETKEEFGAIKTEEDWKKYHQRMKDASEAGLEYGEGMVLGISDTMRDFSGKIISEKGALGDAGKVVEASLEEARKSAEKDWETKKGLVNPWERGAMEAGVGKEEYIEGRVAAWQAAQTVGVISGTKKIEDPAEEIGKKMLETGKLVQLAQESGISAEYLDMTKEEFEKFLQKMGGQKLLQTESLGKTTEDKSAAYTEVATQLSQYRKRQDKKTDVAALEEEFKVEEEILLNLLKEYEKAPKKQKEALEEEIEKQAAHLQSLHDKKIEAEKALVDDQAKATAIEEDKMQRRRDAEKFLSQVAPTLEFDEAAIEAFLEGKEFKGSDQVAQAISQMDDTRKAALDPRLLRRYAAPVLSGAPAEAPHLFGSRGEGSEAANAKEQSWFDKTTVGGIYNYAAKVVGDDILLRSGGAPPVHLNNKDDILAAKPGGAVDRALKAAGGAAAGGPVAGGGVVINIYGDEAKVYRVVKRVLSELKMV